MLRSLDIRDILIIDHLVLDLAPGLNVLTGETGAGKSILLDALGFVLGWRGRADLVRQGAAQGEVTAVFDLPPGHPARAVLEEAGLPGGDELVLRRVNAGERKTAWVNDRRVGGDVLRRLSDGLVELHGQQDDRGLLDARSHLGLLDDFADAPAEVAAVGEAWRALAAARRARKAAEAELSAAREEEDFLRHAVAELEALRPEEGEEAQLDTRRRAMQVADRVVADVQRAAAAISPDGAEGRVADAARWLEGAEGSIEEGLAGPLAALERVMADLSDAQAGIEAVLEALAFDPLELEATEERLFALRGLARKHGVAADDLATLAEDLAARRDALDGGADLLAGLAQAEAVAEAGYASAAAALTARRTRAARALEAAMAREMAPLKMERAVFAVQIAPGLDGPAGRDAVRFEVATNPGAPAGPLDRIASGGELSRFLLALKVCLTRDATGLTLIFDEIDRGVGGATADAVGRRLAALGARPGGQVLVVTHSPQVAALGDHHWRVEKAVHKGLTLSRVVPLDPAARVDEIARMLSGDRVSDEARGAAVALLAT